MKTLLRTSAVGALLLIALAAAFYVNPIWFATEYLRFGLWREGVASRYVDAGGYRLHYLEAKSKSSGGTPLLLIHGLGGRSEDWAPLIAKLAANGFDVYAPDLLGYGRSPRPDVDYSIALQEKTVLQFMQTMGIVKADVGGWSMGGWVAAKLALDHPEVVDRLVLYDSAGLYVSGVDTSIFTPKDEATLARLNDTLEPEPRKIPDFAATAELKLLKQNAWVVQRSVDAMVGGRDLLDFRLQGLRKPTLVVWGTKDHLLKPEVGESMHHLIQNSSLTLLDGCGHLAPAQCAQSTLQTTLQFLKSQPPMANVEQTLPGR